MSPADLLAQLHHCWNSRDAEGFAALFHEAGVSIGFDGSTEVGAAIIAQHLGAIFADHTPAHYIGRVDAVQELSADIAIVRAIAGMIPAEGGDVVADRNAMQTIVATRAGGEWKIMLFQNTPAQFDGRPEAVEEMTEALRGLQSA